MQKSSSLSCLPLDDAPKYSETPSLHNVEIHPCSPTKFSRMNEKEELSNLNDRLACYIEKVRDLEIENSQLIRKVNSSLENTAGEVAGVKSLYDKELLEARILIDELSKEKVMVEMDARRLFIENDGLKSELDKKNKECLLFQTSLSVCEGRSTEISSKYNQVLNEKKRLIDENISLKDDKNDLSGQLLDVKKQLEEEILQRVDKENALQTLNEDIAFKEQLFEQQLKEVSRKKQTEITELDTLCQEYQNKLYQGLQDVREQYELDLVQNKEEIKSLFEEKVRSLERQVKRYSKGAAVTADVIQNMKSNIDVLNKKISSLEEERNNALSEVKKLEIVLEKEKAKSLKACHQNEEEIAFLHKEMDKRNKEYVDLMDIKIALDLEINAYRKLLEGEEERLKITPKCSPETLKVPCKVQSFKRKRLFSEKSEELQLSNYSYTSSTKCDVSIAKVCYKGEYIILTNKTNNEVELGGWKLINCAGKLSTVYEFHHNSKLAEGGNITVWSCNVPGINQQPENLVMKCHSWLSEDFTTTTLYNPAGKEMAIYEQKKQQLSDKLYSKEMDESLLKKKSPRDNRTLENKEEKCLVM